MDFICRRQTSSLCDFIRPRRISLAPACISHKNTEASRLGIFSLRFYASNLSQCVTLSAMPVVVPIRTSQILCRLSSIRQRARRNRLATRGNLILAHPPPLGVRESHARKRGATVERLGADVGHAIGNRHARKSGAIFERPVIDRRQLTTFRKGYTRKLGTEKNASLPILSTLAGMVMLVRPSQS